VVCADATGRFYAAVRSESSFGVGISTYRGEAGPTGFGWTGPVTVGPGGFSKDVDSPSIACDENGLVYVVYAEMEKVGDPLAGGHWVHSLRLHRSTDAAQTFEPVLSLAGPFIGDGRIAVGQDGAVIILWHDYSSGQVLGRRSVDQGLSFGPPFHVGAMLDNIGTEPAGWASNFARRNPYYFMLVGHAVPNAPSLAVDRTDGPQRGVIYAAWSEHAEGAPQPVSVMNELEPNELFVQAMSIVVGSEIVGSAIDPSKLTPGDFDRFYFEGTKGMVVQLEGELTDISPEPNFAFRSAARIECGEDSTRLQLLGHLNLVRPSYGPTVPYVMTLPRTGRYWITTNPASIWSFAYRIRLRDLTPTPTSAARDHRDIVLVRSTDGGATWSEKVRVNDCRPATTTVSPKWSWMTSGRCTSPGTTSAMRWTAAAR
jgi:hypothetical protein